MLFQPKYDITFVCYKGKEHFAEPILKILEKKYSIQYLFLERNRDYWHYKVKGKVIWNEWANKFAWHISKKNWKDRKVFVRLHRYEIETKYMQMIKWQNISNLIFVNHQYELDFKNRIDDKANTITIPNALDVNSFPFLKKNYDKNICALSVDFDIRKGYLNLIRTFNKLIKLDNEFKLNIIAIKSANSDEQRKILDAEIKILDLNNSVNIIQRNKNNNLKEERSEVANLLNDNDIIISYSDDESFHYSFAEGLLVGLQGFYNMWENPLIKEFWEDFGYNSEDEFIKGILDWSKLSNEDKLTKSLKNRQYVIDNFGDEVIANKYEELFFGVNK